MRPEDRALYLVRPADEGHEAPETLLDVELVALDSELDAAGGQARRSLHGRTQPTRYFSIELRARLLGRLVGSTSSS
jgi:hypothetical protein